MQPFESLEAGRFYHVYSHAVGGREMFIDDENCDYFLKLYDKYISAVADTYAWVLMKNHFHLLVRVKEGVGEGDGFISPDRVSNPVRAKDERVSHQFSKLFNAYAQAINKRHNFRGALFERPFKRKPIDNIAYMKNVVAYIHHNPVHHGFCQHPVEYGWSSYLSCVTEKSTKLKRDEVLAWFGDIGHFERFHLNPLPQSEMEKWLGI